MRRRPRARAATDALTQLRRPALPRTPLRCSILLVQEPGAKLRSVADDLYARALESALDDVLRALRVEAPAGEEQQLRMQPILVSTSARAGTPTAASSQALLRAVLLEEEER